MPCALFFAGPFHRPKKNVALGKAKKDSPSRLFGKGSFFRQKDIPGFLGISFCRAADRMRYV